ncbi:MAG: carboxypeptidase regulatory-like domain-containing protein [Pyrinomonadaceae bacterium]|nr:carboxypeptidase regulatory-like domain-containing protein [Pyrinomonadaceae bacterium]
MTRQLPSTRFRLTATGTITQSAALTTTNAFTQNAGTFQGGTANLNFGAFELTAGTFTATAGVLNINNSFFSATGGTFNANSGTVSINSNSQNFNAPLTFNNLTFTNTSNPAANSIINGTLTLQSGQLNGGASLIANGNVVYGAGFTGGQTKIRFQDAATRTVQLNASNGLLGMIINNPNITVRTADSAASTIISTTTLQQGRLEQGSGDLTFAAFGNFNVPGFDVSGGTFQGSTGAAIFNTTIGLSSGNLNAGSGNFGTNVTNCPAFPQANYFFQQSGGSFNGSSSNAKFCDLRRTGGSFTAPSGNLTILTYGDFTGGTFNANNGTLIIENNVTIIAPGFALNNVTLSGVNAHSIAGTPKPQINGTFDLAEGQFSSGEVAANGDVVYGANFTGGGGRLFFEGTATRTINLPARNILLGMTLDNPNVTVTTSGAGASTFVNFVEVKRGLFQQGNAVLNFGINSLNVSGGTFQGSSSDLNAAGIATSGGAFQGGAGLVNVTGTINTSGGTFSSGGAVNLFTYTQTGGTFNAPNGLMTVVADWTHTAGGNFNPGTSGTVKFTGYNTFNCANTIFFSATTTETFNNLEIANTFCNRRLVFPNATLIVNGDLRLTAAGIEGGKIRPLGTTTIDAGNNSYVSSTILEYIAPNRAFVINNPSEATRTLPIEMNAPNSTLTSSGTGRLNVYALDLKDGTVNQGAGVWDLTNAGLIQNFGFYKQSGGTFNGNSFELFVNPQLSGGEFNSGTGKFTGNPLITGGTMTLNGDMDSTELTLQGGTFNAPLGTLKLGAGGNCIFSHTTVGGTFNPRTGTVIANPCNFDVNARETFNNLIFTGGGGSIATNDTLVANGTTTFNGSFSNGGSIEANGDVQHSNGGSGNTNGNPNTGTTVLKFVDTATRTINFNTSNANYTVINTLVDNPNITINLGTTENATASFNNGLTLRQGTINQGAGQVPILIYNQSGGTYNGGTYSSNTNLNQIGNFTLSGGTFNAAPTTTFNGNFTHTAGGEFNEGTGTVFFVSTFNGANGIIDVNGTETFNNVNFRSGNGTNIASGDTLIINGLTTLQAGTINGGTLDVKRNVEALAVNLGGSFRGGDANVIFSGATDQIFTNPSGFPTFGGTWMIDKPNSSGFADKSENNSAIAAPSTLFLNGNVGNSNTGGSLPLSFPNMNLVSGFVEQGSGANLSLGSFSSALGTSFINLGDGDLILAGNLTNNGFMNINGSGSGCPQPDAVLFRSSVAGTQRNWNGSGTFRITDVDVQDQAGNALITANSSTNAINNGANWTFTGNCLTTASTVAIGGKVTNAKGRGIANVRLTLTSSDGAVRQTVTNAFGVYRFVEVRAGETYLIEARAKRFQFSDSTQSVSVTEDLSNINFTALQ